MREEADLSPSPEFAEEFRAAAGPDGALTFARFVELALYHPRVGYYRQARRRIGRRLDADFFTASSLGPVFGQLVAAACASLLPAEEAGRFDFVEIGSDGPGVLAEVAHPFRSARAVALGDPLWLEGRCVVFSNELFDAQPFHRFVFRRGVWRELGVAWRDGGLREIELAGSVPPAPLPRSAPEGYLLDAPLGAVALAERIAAQPWNGLFVACDYGLSGPQLTEDRPEGTARGYFRHTPAARLLDRPGRQDLTCHVCWDWLEGALARGGFTALQLESQESFFVRHAAEFIAAATRADAARFSRRKQTLLELLHPAHLGQKFQVLRGTRA